MSETEAGFVIENPVTGERGIMLEAPQDNPQRRLLVELYPRYAEMTTMGTPEQARSGVPVTPSFGEGAGPPA